MNCLDGISIIVPMKNEVKHIEKCLLSVIESAVISEKKFEVIVVDNDSVDGSYQVAKGFDVSLLKTDANSPGAVRNYGAAVAQYSILAFIDADIEVPKKWLTCLFNYYEKDKNIGALGGPCLAPRDASWLVCSLYPTQLKDKISENAKLPGANFTVRKTIFEDLGGFNQDLISAEDDDLSLRILASGSSCISDTRLAVIHHGYPNTLNGIFERQVWHGSTQIKAHGYFTDKMTIATYLFIFCNLMLLLASLLPTSMFLLAFITEVCLLTVVGFNFQKNKKSFSLKELFQSIFISFFFLLGRGIGLIKELLFKF